MLVKYDQVGENVDIHEGSEPKHAAKWQPVE